MEENKTSKSRFRETSGKLQLDRFTDTEDKILIDGVPLKKSCVRHVILEKSFHGGGPSRGLGRTGKMRIKSSKVRSSDQKKRLAKRKSIERKTERRENIAAYGSDIDKE